MSEPTGLFTHLSVSNSGPQFPHLSKEGLKSDTACVKASGTYGIKWKCIPEAITLIFSIKF